MNRIVINGNMSGRAMTPAATREAGLAAFARFGRAIASAARRRQARTQLANELHGLSDRSLSDIGISRDAITALVTDAVPAGDEGSLFAEFSRLVVNGVLRPLIDWNRRRKARAALMALEDRILMDIGLARHEIDAHVATLRGASGNDLPATVAVMESDVIAPLKVWQAARTTEKELSRLTDRQLMDIGVVRSEIASLAGDLAAANTNQMPATPKAA
jgi:uncharacterized protein YjiS (DUF1127 family)